MFGWPISGKGRFIPAHMQRSKIQVVYSFSSPECKNGKSSIILGFSFFWKSEKRKKELFSYFSVFNIKLKNEWSEDTLISKITECFLEHLAVFKVCDFWATDFGF